MLQWDVASRLLQRVDRIEKLEAEAVASFAVAQPECRNGTLDFQEAVTHVRAGPMLPVPLSGRHSTSFLTSLPLPANPVI